MRFQQMISRLSGDAPVVLELDPARGLVEHRPNNPLQVLQLINATTMTALREKLHEAAQDKSVRGLILHATGSGPSVTTLEEVSDLVEEFGRHKPTVAWAETFGEMTSALTYYLVASAADEVWLQPTGDLNMPGVEMQILLLKGLFNKLHVEPQFGKRHQYKTAADTYAADEVTEANREMTSSMAQSLVEEMVTTIARRRQLSKERVWEAVNTGFLTPGQARDFGLVDRIGYRDEVYEATLKAWEAKPDELRYVSHYRPRHQIAKILAKPQAPKVAVVDLRGGIVTGRSSQGPAGEVSGSDVVDEHLRQALRDDKVKGVLFTIDSPGGSAVASDFIRRGVLRLKEAGKPVVAQMGALAASGGYYAAMGCNEIVAHRATLTGSIGVLGGKMVTQGLFERLDLKREPVRVGARAGTMSNAEEFSEDDWHVLDEMLDRIYEDFTRFAAEDRGMDYEQLEALAKGRVWTGAQAVEKGLVDHVGGWRTAYERVCELADLDPETASVERMGIPGILERFVPATSSQSSSGAGIGLGMSLPDAEQLLMRGARMLGLPIDGALSLPFRIDVR